MPIVAYGVSVFVTVEAMTPGSSESRGAGGGHDEATSQRRVVSLKRGNNSETFCIVLFF